YQTFGFEAKHVTYEHRIAPVGAGAAAPVAPRPRPKPGVGLFRRAKRPR
ncbi:MAG: hypothetical protein QOK01_1816, partial [Alphaproteobacteria bacterium]|nr:hypothetical protein [Alphaproteobacteria bacterium]